MLDLLPDRPTSEALRVLCLGAHSDDVEIGCGGTLLRLSDEVPDLDVRWLVFSGAGLALVQGADDLLFSTSTSSHWASSPATEPK